MIESIELMKDVPKDIRPEIDLSKTEKNIDIYIENMDLKHLKDGVPQKDIVTSQNIDGNISNNTIEHTIENTLYKDFKNSNTLTENIRVAPEEYKRPYIRQEVRNEIELKAPKDNNGRFLDANTGLPIEGKYDLGHKPGHEFWRESQKAKEACLTQEEFNDKMNDPKYYQIEDPSENRSHKHEMKDR